MKEAAEMFEDFLLDRPQQESAIQLGFRPADKSIALTAPLDAQHGVDPQQPYTVLEVPKAEVITAVQELWTQVKKPVDLVVVMDVSGSMGGDKITAARVSLTQFIDLLYDRDRLEIITFGSEIITMTPLTGLGEKRIDITRRVSGIIEGGDTRLYDAIQQAYLDLESNGDPKHIRAVVVLSDGQDTASNLAYGSILEAIRLDSETGGNAVKLFTVAYGDDADIGILKELAEVTGGKQYQGDPEDILEIYTAIATFF
jgi:Ca-activated chloride channel family protein